MCLAAGVLTWGRGGQSLTRVGHWDRRQSQCVLALVRLDIGAEAGISGRTSVTKVTHCGSLLCFQMLEFLKDQSNGRGF